MADAILRSALQLAGDAPRAYDEFIVDAFMRGYTRRLVAAASVVPGDRVLDVACGTGVVALEAAERTGPQGGVVGLDLNAGMLARARAARVGPGCAVLEWQEASATAMPFEDGSFDVVLCQQVLQFRGRNT